MPWTARRELQKLHKGQYLDISTDIPEGEADPANARTAANTETTCHKNKTWNSRSSDNMFVGSNTEAPLEREPDWSSGDTALEVLFEMKLGKHAFQKTCRDMCAFVTSAATKGAQGGF